jgi:hypothetical protein
MVGTVEVVGSDAGMVARAWIEAKVIRADGTIEDLGIIADSGPIGRQRRPGLLQRLKEWLNG